MEKYFSLGPISVEFNWTNKPGGKFFRLNLWRIHFIIGRNASEAETWEWIKRTRETGSPDA